MIPFGHPERIELDRELSRRSFAQYIRLAWPRVDRSAKYVHNWHMDCIGEHLQAMAQGELTRVLFNVPPGTSKSSAAGVYFPSWLWGPFGMPHARYIGCSYEQGLATRDNRRTRTLIETDWFQQRWPTAIVTDQNEKTNFENTSGGFRQSSAVASMTGKRGHFVSWDDPQNPEGAESEPSRETSLRIFKETLPHRLVDPVTSCILIIMQRLHQNDVSGHILASDIGYTHVCLPMELEQHRACYTVLMPKHILAAPVQGRYSSITGTWVLNAPVDSDTHPGMATTADLEPGEAESLGLGAEQTIYRQDPRLQEGELLMPSRFPRAVVEADKKVMGEYAVAGQYQQTPTSREGGLFKVESLKLVDTAPPLHEMILCRGWDFAGTGKEEKRKNAKPAYSVGLLMGYHPPTQIYTVLHAWRDRVSSGALKLKVVELAELDNEAVDESCVGLEHAVPQPVTTVYPQDPGAAGKYVVRDIAVALAGYHYKAELQSGDKVTRATPFASAVEAGLVQVLNGPWTRTWLDEIKSFPSSTFKDQVDASASAFNFLSPRKQPQLLAVAGATVTNTAKVD